jgi:hypothetical protein
MLPFLIPLYIFQICGVFYKQSFAGFSWFQISVEHMQTDSDLRW